LSIEEELAHIAYSGEALAELEAFFGNKLESKREN
jgi:hypothetical protein